MLIEREPHMERWLLDQIAASFGTGIRGDGLHASDLRTPRQRYWQEVVPRPADDAMIQYWVAGLGHESVYGRVTGLDKGEPRQWEGIWFTPDWNTNIPSDLKTRRRNLAKPGEEAIVYDHYLWQMRQYCAMSGTDHARLFVFSLLERDALGEGTAPALASYLIAFTAEELEIHRRAGRGKPTPRLVVLTGAMFREMSGPLPSDEDGYVVEPSEVLASYVNLSPKILKARLAAAGHRDSAEFYASRPEAKSSRARIEKEFKRLFRAGTPWDRATIFAALTEPIG